MDERILKTPIKIPIPKWEVQHRLPLTGNIGPQCKDTATIFKINYNYMDVSDQPYMKKQWLAGSVILIILIIYLCFYVLYKTNVTYPNMGGLFSFFYCFSIILICIYFLIKFGRDEFFSLTHRPIRFNRKEQKIYTIRRRRFFAKPGQGDITWEVQWDDSAIFCIHKGVGSFGNCYHIRCYTVDHDGNVVRAFAIGREWEGAANLEGLLSQWNYWCWYMNHGPADLPQPALYFKEKEDIIESFLFCMYDLGFTASSLARLIMMPLILLMTSHRLMALWTCRAPVWPLDVEQASIIEAGDPFEQPRGDTPVGWAQTALAREAQTYPFDPKRKTHGWRGEPDGARNAELWAQDIPPQMV